MRFSFTACYDYFKYPAHLKVRKYILKKFSKKKKGKIIFIF